MVQGNAPSLGGQALPPSQLSTRQIPGSLNHPQGNHLGSPLPPGGNRVQQRPRPLNHKGQRVTPGPQNRLTNRFPPVAPGRPDPRTPNLRQGRETLNYVNLLSPSLLQGTPPGGQLIGDSGQNGYYIHSRAKRADESHEEYRNKTLNMVIKTGSQVWSLSSFEVSCRLLLTDFNQVLSVF